MLCVKGSKKSVFSEGVAFQINDQNANANVRISACLPISAAYDIGAVGMEILNVQVSGQ